MVSPLVPLYSAIVATVVLLFGSNLTQSLFANREIVYEAKSRPSPTGTSLLSIKNPSTETCQDRIELRFKITDANITSSKLLDTNEAPVKVTNGKDQIVIESPRLSAANGFIDVEFTYILTLRGNSEKGVSCPV